jgi:hypothetical protein
MLGLLDKKSSGGTWRSRAFELSDRSLAYEEMRSGKRVRAEIPVRILGAAAVEGGELRVTECGGVRVHSMRPSAEVGQPPLEAWRAAIEAALSAAAAGRDPAYGPARCLRTRAPLRLRGALLKKGGSRSGGGGGGGLARRLSFKRTNWSERRFALDFERGVLEYFDGETRKGAVVLTRETTVTCPDAVSLRGTHAAGLSADADPCYAELAGTLDDDRAPRDHFSIRAPDASAFAEWVLALKTCVASLRPDDHPAAFRGDVDRPPSEAESSECFVMAHNIRLTSDPPPPVTSSSSMPPRPRSFRRESDLEPVAEPEPEQEPEPEPEPEPAAADRLADAVEDTLHVEAAPPPPAPDDEVALGDLHYFWQDAAGEQRGPSNLEEYTAAFADGETRLDCLIYAAGVADEWLALENVPRLRERVAPAPAPSPPKKRPPPPPPRQPVVPVSD